MYLHQDLVQLATKHSTVKPSAYVDDITLTARHLSAYDLTIEAIEALEDFASLSNKLKLTLSDKGQLVCTDTKLGNRLAKILRRKGIPVTHVYQAKDLGVVNAAGKPIRRDGVSQRISNSRHRVKAIVRLSKISPMARRLYSGSAFSVSTWGHVSRMLSDSSIAQLERDAANASGIKVTGRNLFMTNLVAYGKYSHPVARLYTDLVQSHFNVMKSIINDGITIETYRKAWTTVYAKVQAKHKQDSRKILQASTGPIYNTISMLLAIDWDPIFPDLWKHKGESYVYDSKTSVKVFSKYVVDSLNEYRHAISRTPLLWQGRGSRHQY